ncbi:MAG TPA: hypothetical protein DEH78_32925 [Solibacterales bacterium]|nr:hypothetical protein [Bryobacterales bacterium]
MRFGNPWWKRRRREEELDEELRVHLAMAIQDLVAQGEDPREAERAARREFGNATLVGETTRAMWGAAWPEQVVQDLRHACRNLWRRRMATAVVVASLALGIGANIALFSVAYPILLRPLPVSHPEELVELLQKYPEEPRGNGYWTQASYDYYRQHNEVFSALIATSIDHVTRLETRPPEVSVVVGESVGPDYFRALGVGAALGRVIGSEDRGAAVAVLSWSQWRTRFQGSPAVLGTRIVVNGQGALVIGVAARRYSGLLANAQTEVWTPLKPGQGLNLLGRLKPGVTLEQARRQMEVLYRFTREERAANSKDPRVRDLRVEVEPARSGMASLRDRVGAPLQILLALVAVLLLLACVNIAGIVLAQAAGRGREMAVRAGLGASRGRLVRQVLTETCLLSLIGTALGVGVAYAGTATLLRILDSGRLHERVRLLVEVDGAVVLFAATLALVAGLAIGLAPAVHVIRPEHFTRLRPAGAALLSRSQRRFGRALVSMQVALALLLLACGALFTANLAQLRGKDLGFQRDHVLLARLEAGRSGYSGERLAAALRQAVQEASAIPGVLTASLASPTPLMGAAASAWLAAEGFEEQPKERRRILISWVAPRYFEVLRIPVVAGRDFAAGDEAETRTAILSRAAARYYFPGKSALGKRITLDQMTLTKGASTYEVVGVVGNAHYGEIRETDQRQVYLPAFGPGRVTARTIVLRTAVGPEGVARDLAQVVERVAPGLALARVGTLEAQIDASIVPERLIATLSGFFAVVGGLLAGMGLYGLLAYTVTQRTGEIGVRMALGATPAAIVRMVAGEAMAITVVGALAGLPLALFGRTAAARLLPEVTATPGVAVAAGVAALLLIAAAAAVTPARRATRVDAVQCLRHE